MSEKLIREIRACTVCKDFLPFSPKPVLSFSRNSKIMLIGQAPGTRVQESGIPWNDASGERLRDWLGVPNEAFYKPSNFAIVPMGFCYPGNNGNGDLPPRPECAKLWMERILQALHRKQLLILIGQYSQRYFLQEEVKSTLTETVRHWQEYLPHYFVLPHPSPRNNIWLKKNVWFEKEVLPDLQKTVQRILKSGNQ